LPGILPIDLDRPAKFRELSPRRAQHVPDAETDLRMGRIDFEDLGPLRRSPEPKSEQQNGETFHGTIVAVPDYAPITQR
jgi:hypothetical protein